jgi:hypothetical protein
LDIYFSEGVMIYRNLFVTLEAKNDPYGGDAMRNAYRFVFVMVVVVISTMMAGCSARQMVTLQDNNERSCAQGRVFCKIPTDSAPVPYASVTVTAWHHEKNQPLTETKTDREGNYCIEVPLGDFQVDLRVWGMVQLPTISYTCTGSEDNIDLGTAPKRCGENCKKIEIMLDCKEFIPVRQR